LSYKKYFSLRIESKFESFSTDIKYLLRILLKISLRQPLHSICENLDISSRTVIRFSKKLKSLILFVNFSESKLGGPGKVVQIDETMINYKVKSHRGRASSNRTDSLCIVEFDQHITRAFACCIPNKQQTTIVPILIAQVLPNSVVHTNEHRAYRNLRNFNFNHETVCHKYWFVEESGVHTQAVESFNNSLKLEIKNEKVFLLKKE
jgi:transposase-like protein